MPIAKLDHYSIRTSKLDETRAFYTEMLGLEVGPRPNFPFPGVWLYSEGTAVVHVVGIDPNDKAGLLAYLGDKPTEDVPGTGTIDHIAFTATGLPAMLDRIATRRLPLRERRVPDLGLYQVFLEDPNGVTIELNYPAAEAPAA